MSSSAPQSVPQVFRTHTPADLKWLLNERAAVLGEITRCHQQCAELQPKIARLQRQLQRCVATVAGIEQRLLDRKSSLASLDHCIELCYVQVEPSSGGSVKAWAGKYGPRGGLKRFLAKVLEDAAPAPVDTVSLTKAAVTQFNLSFFTGRESAQFRKTLKNTLRYLEVDGFVEALHERQASRAPSVWRWIGNKPPSFAEMALADKEARAHDPGVCTGEVPHAPGHQVAPEREGGAHG